ncbi:MAG: FAD-dependent thymidylate synthase [Rickettsiales bacterium]|jgi:thymidylate synthase (FAD)|nr:FAD-dependent thymidylate synthase [Rickettsiales bacterium]
MIQTKENDDLTKQTNITKRAISPGIEKILYDAIPVLDHGFVRVVDYMGDDSAIVQAARVSYGKGTKRTNQDRGLIQYLMRHRHTTPFEMCDIKFHIKLPIFIARQWIRHRTASVNEYSARYSILANEFYTPKPENMAMQSKINKQGRDNVLSPEESKKVLHLLKQDAEQCYSHYQEMLNEDEEGNILNPENPQLARELARMNLNLNFYTEWYWKINLHNLFHFLALRADSHAQYEIRVYAEVMLNIVKEWVPFAYEAFMEYQVNSASFSGNAIKAIKAMLKGEKITAEASGMSKREWGEFCNTLDLEQN